jgi:hypothetical protein
MIGVNTYLKDNIVVFLGDGLQTVVHKQIIQEIVLQFKDLFHLEGVGREL